MKYVQRIHGERHPCHQFTNKIRPTQTKQQVSPCFQFPRLILRIVEIVAPDAVEFGALQEHVNEKGVSRRNGSLRLTKFCNDFFKVGTLTRWCRNAALTVSNCFPNVFLDRTLSTSVATHEWSHTRKAPICKRVPSVQPELRLESCFMNLPRMDENPCVFAFLKRYFGLIL